MAGTEALITALAADAGPVRRLRPPAARAALWLGFAALLVAMLGISHGVRPDLPQRLADPVFGLRVLAAVATGVLAAVAAFMLCLPDRSERWVLLPLPAAALWATTIGYGCFAECVSLGPGGVRVGAVMSCLATLTLISTPLSLALYVMVRHASRFRPTPVALCGALAVAAIAATALSLFHDLDATILTLVWNFGTAAVCLCLGALAGRRLAARSA